MNDENRLFVDSGVTDPLPPIYKGRKIRIWPGQLAKRTGTFNQANGSTSGHRRFGLRRYIFRYEGDKFVYLATRKGQRNGGNTSTPQQSIVTFNITVPNVYNASLNFTYTGKNDNNEDVYAESANSRIRYNSALTRWEWETRPQPLTGPPTGPFYTNAYSQATTNTIKNSGAKNQIRWTYVSDPWDTATPELPATVKFGVKQWFNNNSVDNLNQWPITNTDMNFGKYPGITYKWVVPGGENRPDCITDDILFKCFQGINLKNYDTVFIEVMWTWFENRRFNGKFWGYSPDFGTANSIHNYEWWSPKPFLTKRQKGRIYRIGILDGNNGVGNTDKVLFAQRTRVVTTKYMRGGNTALD